MGRHVRRMLSLIKVSGGNCGVPGRLSNNRRRHVMVTHTMLGSPTVVLTSRPAKGLSMRANGSVMRLLRGVYRANSSMIVAARGLRLLGRCPNEMCHYTRRRVASIASRCVPQREAVRVSLGVSGWGDGRGRDFGI